MLQIYIVKSPFLTFFSYGGSLPPKKSRNMSSTALSGFRCRTSPFNRFTKVWLKVVLGLAASFSTAVGSLSVFWSPFCSDGSSVSFPFYSGKERTFFIHDNQCTTNNFFQQLAMLCCDFIFSYGLKKFLLSLSSEALFLGDKCS